MSQFSNLILISRSNFRFLIYPKPIILITLHFSDFSDSVYSDLGKRFEDLKSNWSSSPIEFMPKRQCSSTLATSETPTLVSGTSQTTSSGNGILDKIYIVLLWF